MGTKRLEKKMMSVENSVLEVTMRDEKSEMVKRFCFRRD
jgi:hypothetical protein